MQARNAINLKLKRAKIRIRIARPLATAEDAAFNAFGILNNLNIPVGSTAAQDKIARDITSATQITTASDLKNRTLYFHTMNKFQIQKLDRRKIDFATVEHPLLT